MKILLLGHKGMLGSDLILRLGRKHEVIGLDKRALAVKLYDEKEHTVSQICQMMGISKPTLYKYIEADREVTS